MPLIFQVEPLRFSFVTREDIYFPAGKAANILRGAFGIIFRQIACLPQCEGARQCERRGECPYAQLFEPRSAGKETPSGLADHPRPFVFRAIHLDGQTFKAGQRFHFDLHLFDNDPASIAYFVLAFAQLAREGLGPARRKVELMTVSRLNEDGESSAIVYAEGVLNNNAGTQPLKLDLAPGTAVVSSVRVTFVTPTELKSGQQIAAMPEFGILAARVRDRLSTLRELYGEGPLDLDFRQFGERAALVQITRSKIEAVDVQRRSSRTGQTHSIGGFVGEVDYEGDLTEFVPYLKAAQWTGVGRQTVWGKGEIRTRELY
jgi:hypothetical protein